MFFLVVFAILGLINFYLFRVAASAYPEWAGAIGGVVAFLFLSIFAGFFLERAKRYRLATFFSWIGYTWLGVAGIGLFFGAAVDLVQALSGLGQRAAFHWTAGLTAAASLYGAIEARRVSTKRIRVESPKLVGRERPLRVVQVSDLHLGECSSAKRTRELVTAINRLEPDIVVSTGDLLDGYLHMMEPYLEELRGIRAPGGKFAIGGNHELYAGLEEAMQLTRLAGFRTLRDEAAEVGGDLRIVGVEDPTSPRKRDEAEALGEADERRFTLLLKHRPDIDGRLLGKFDLQLSGHTHGGQIFPFHLLTRAAFRARPGLNRLGAGSLLYLSRGTGSWGPQIRFLAPPELTLIELAAAG